MTRYPYFEIKLSSQNFQFPELFSNSDYLFFDIQFYTICSFWIRIILAKKLINSQYKIHIYLGCYVRSLRFWNTLKMINAS